VKDKADPEGFRDRVITLFEEWLRLLPLAPDEKVQISASCHGDVCKLFHPTPSTCMQAISSYLLNLRASGMMELDDSTDRFLRLWIELSVNHALVHLEPPQVEGYFYRREILCP
jgi:hypothetical protein